MKSGAVVVFDNVRKVANSMRALAENQVLVGVPQEEAPRKGEPISNAQLGYIHETGAPEANIPARPHLVPGVSESRDDWLPRLRESVKASFEGRDSAVLGNMNGAGLIAQNAVHKKIQANIPPPLAESTVYARQHRKKNRRKASTVTALIDTGQYLKSLIYVIRKRK